MNERRAQMLRFHGFVMIGFALLQGFLIAAGVGKPEAQARAHIEIFMTAFLVILLGLNATELKLNERMATAVFFTTLASAYLGIVHTFVVASFGATSIHVRGTAAPAVEKILPVIGGLAGLLFLPAIGLTLYGLRPGKAGKKK